MSRKKLWPTPRSSDGNGPGQHGDGGLDLRTVVQDSVLSVSYPSDTTPALDANAHATSQLTFLQQAFPVSPPVLPGSSEARMMTAGSGAKLSGLFKNSGPAGWCLRTLLESSAWSSTIVRLKWTSKRIRRQTSEIWVLKPTRLSNEQGEEYWMRLWSRSRVRVTKYGSTYIQLVPSTPRTDETASSLWRTPDASVTTGGAANAEDRKAQGHAIGLHDQVNMPSMWPTPAASQWKGTGPPGSKSQQWDNRTKRLKGDDRLFQPMNDVNRNLETAVSREMWGTPSAHSRTHSPRDVDHGVQLANQVGGQLNPPWECSMMGFPPGWLDIENDGPTVHGKTDSPE